MAAIILVRLAFAAVVAMLTVGAVTAWTSTNLVKRLAGAIIAETAALVSATLLGAGQAAMAGVAVILATTLIGAALIVRLQESYGVAEAPEIDRADIDAEPDV